MPDFLHKRYKKDSKVEEKVKETFDRFHELNVDNSHYINKFLEVYEKDKMCGRHLFPLKQVYTCVILSELIAINFVGLVPGS